MVAGVESDSRVGKKGDDMSSRESVTEWLKQLKHGESQAAQKLWQRYIERLVRLARKHLRTTPRRVADEEDVAVAAFAEFLRSGRGRAVLQARGPG